MASSRTLPAASHQTTGTRLTNRPSREKNGDTFLCSKCNGTDLQRLFREELSVFMRPAELKIGLKHQSLYDLHPQCGLCCLLRVVWPGAELGPPYHLTAHLLSYRDPPDQMTSRSIRISGTPPGESASHYSWTRRGHRSDTFNCIIQAPIDFLRATLQIDFQRLKSWVEHCYYSHGLDCAADTEWELVEGMNLIDIPNRCIVEVPNYHVRYAALSYVWGVQEPAVETRDGFPTQLPKTIEDAMQATLQLGLDYLWVDKYCIPQRNLEKKQHQINKMHRIYQQAYVTIAVAAGSGPDYGLPGLSIARVPLPHVVMDGRLFVGIPTHPLCGGVVAKSQWKTRAWTYQEEIFSKRILYFTDSQVVFKCEHGAIGIDEPTRNFTKSGVQPLVNDLCDETNNLAPFVQRVTQLKKMQEHICTINKRQITYESDRVNTIAGIFSHMKAKDVIRGHLSGVPIWNYQDPHVFKARGWESGFLSGLAWVFWDLEGRRKGFPSWTWAGWKGHYGGNFDVRHDNIRLWFELQPDMSIALSQADHESASESPTNCIPSQEFWSRLDSGELKSECCRFIHMEALVVHCRFRCGARGWQLAYLEGRQIHEDIITVHFEILVSEEPGLESLLALNTYRGLCLTWDEGKGLFVIVLRDYTNHSERIGYWITTTRLSNFAKIKSHKSSRNTWLKLRRKPLHGRLTKSEKVAIRKEKVRLG